jgi:D-alanyl-D-alanine carboxypeptidase
MKAKIFTVLLFIAFFSGTISAQTFNKPKMDSLLNVLSDKNKAMGSLAITKNGNVVYSKTIGYSLINEKEKKPSSTNTKYRIGSISKMFTTTMIFQLIEEGKITIGTSLDKYFAGIPNAGKITIGNLLNHHSGIHNFTNDPDYTTYMTQTKTQDEMIAIIAKNKPDFQPGEKGEYSNSNFVLLGYIIEKVTGQPYSKNLTERITSKIGLTNTLYGGKTNVNNNDCYSYSFSGKWTQLPETDMSIPGGAGAIISTPADLNHFIEALFSLKLISAGSLAQMKTISDGYGMGMFQVPFYTKKAYGHNGGIDGFGSTLAYFPEDSLAVSYCTNGMAYPMNDILIGVLSIYFNRDYSIPAFKTISFKSEDLDKYLGVYSSTQIPLKITITRDKSGLVAQATGQPSFPLEGTDKDVFRFEQAGIIMEFDPAKSEMTLKQGGGTFHFTREK